MHWLNFPEKKITKEDITEESFHGNFLKNNKGKKK